MRQRRIATVAVVLAMASGVGWALIELGRPAELVPVPPIVIGEGSAPDPGTTNPDSEGEPSEPGEPGEPGGSGGSPSGGAEPPPAPPPPPAGDDGDDDGDADD